LAAGSHLREHILRIVLLAISAAVVLLLPLVVVLLALVIIVEVSAARIGVPLAVTPHVSRAGVDLGDSWLRWRHWPLRLFGLRWLLNDRLRGCDSPGGLCLWL